MTAPHPVPRAARILAGAGAGVLAAVVAAAIVAIAFELGVDTALMRDESDGARDRMP